MTPPSLQARQHTEFEHIPSTFSSVIPSSIPPSVSPSSTASISRPTSSDTQPSNPISAAAIAFIVIGALVGVILITYITYRLVRRNKSKRQWSPVAGSGMANEKGYSEDEETLVDQPGAIGGRSRLGFNFLSFMSPRSGTGKTLPKEKRERKITLYKVKRNKKGDSFEIDSEANSSLVDLPFKDSDMH